jgi:hypothetical protein
VTEEGDAVRAGVAVDAGVGGDERFDDVELPEHRRRENVHPRAALDQVFGDRSVAEVRRATQGRLPVAAAPVPGGIGKARFLLQERFHSFQVAVTLADEILHQ